MPGVGIDDFGASFKYYLPKFVKTYNEVDTVQNVPLGKVTWEGEEVIKKVQVARNVAITYTADGGHIPSPGKVNYVESKGTRKFQVGSIGITDGLLNNAKTTSHAAVRAVDSEMRGLMSGMRTVRSFFFWGDGSGTVATLGTVPLTATFATVPITVSDARGMWDGQDYEIRDAAAPTTIHASFRVARVARARAGGESQVFLTANLAALGQAAGDFITWKSGVDAAYGKVITGLSTLIDDTAAVFQNVNVALYPRYSSVVLNGGGAPQTLTPALCRTFLATLAQERGEKQVSNLLLGTCVWDAKSFEEMFQGDLRIAPSTQIGGAKIPSFQSVFGTFSVGTFPDAPYNQIFGIERSEISWLKQKELDWRPTGGPQGIFTTQQGYLGYIATALCIDDLFIEDRRRCGKITNLSASVGSAY